MSAIKLKNIKQTVVSGVTQPLSIGGVASDNSDEVLNIASNGDLTLKKSIANPTFTGLITTDGQIKFPATQNPSSDPNTLDDYKEGTWTPILVGGTVAGNHTYGTRDGRYVKIGKLVICTMFLHTATKDAAMSGTAMVQGLPFSVAGYSAFTFAQAEGFTMPSGYTAQYAGLITGTTITLRGFSDGSYNVISAGNISTTSYLIGTFVYISQ